MSRKGVLTHRKSVKRKNKNLYIWLRFISYLAQVPSPAVLRGSFQSSGPLSCSGRLDVIQSLVLDESLYEQCQTHSLVI
jgi:hypothetical protein